MKLVIISIHDAKAEAFLNPLVFQAKAQALRGFQDAVRNPEHEMHKHPEDYTMFFCGWFDPETGQLEPAQPILALANGVEMLAVERGGL